MMDDCGDFVAKFSMSDVKTNVDPGTNELELEGETHSGDNFVGIASVRFVNKVPPGHSRCPPEQCQERGR